MSVIVRRFCILILLILFVTSVPLADAASREWSTKPNRHKKGYVLDRRHKHNHYYPRKGMKIRALPGGYRAVPYRNSRFYFQGGVWYRSSGNRYMVTTPPVGLMVPFLPRSYTTVWVGGYPYYYAGGVYYSWVPEERAYIVTELAEKQALGEDPDTPNRLFIYPKNGQSEDQQATDRYQCHSWARKQTGFDPTQPGGGVEAGQTPDKQNDYNRAMKACLEARGYSVQ
jgi:hypothetical protein